MATQITCVNKDDRQNPYERIINVGGVGWKKAQPAVIREIEAGQQYYVHVGGHSVWVVVGVSRFGNKYLKTQPDRDTPDNLLSLPECR